MSVVIARYRTSARIHADGRSRHLSAKLVNDRIVFSGGISGDHSLCVTSDARRVMAHWRGYCEHSNGGRACPQHISNNALREAVVSVVLRHSDV